MTVAKLRWSMSEREFRFWQAYRARKMLPARRLEVYLAQIASTIARTAGNATLTVEDFILKEDKPMPKTTARDGAMVISALASGPGVRLLGQGRKHKAA